MVRHFYDPNKNVVAHDVIILGCTLPGIVAAHKLKKRFGDTVDVLVIDLVRPDPTNIRPSVGFYVENDEDEPEATTSRRPSNAVKEFLVKYTNELNVPIPDAIIAPEKCESKFNKLFQYIDGKTVPCETNYHDFEYLSWFEKFELNQFQTLLDENMKLLFQTGAVDLSKRSVLHAWDITTMENYICDCLIFRNSREIMRLTVKLVCGAPANEVSLLFYLHQCYRCSSCKNYLDGDNVRLREKLLSYCRKKISKKLEQSVKDITMEIKLIAEIRTYSDQQVILETQKGDSNFVCSFLAMALPPDELQSILIQSELLTAGENEVAGKMVRGSTKKFVVQYEDNFWRKQGYSGDIVSIRGPIVWAMEKPKLASTGSTERFATLIGYLKSQNKNDDKNMKDAVLEQLVNLFGEEAAAPVKYRESFIKEIFIPRCGDFIPFSRMRQRERSKLLVWAPLDVYSDGDVAAALEAGHIAYLNLLRSIRPQAITFEDASMSERPTVLPELPFTRWGAYVNFMRAIHYATIATVLFVGLRMIRRYWK